MGQVLGIGFGALVVAVVLLALGGVQPFFWILLGVAAACFLVAQFF